MVYWKITTFAFNCLDFMCCLILSKWIIEKVELITDKNYKVILVFEFGQYLYPTIK